jgi:hypothetical protein
MQVGIQTAVRQVARMQTERQIYKHAIDIKDSRPAGILYTDIDRHKQTNRQTE